MKLATLGLLLVMSVPAVMAQTRDDARVNDNSVWYNARRGDPTAMNQVGVWYYTGNKVPRDYIQAYEWWSKGAMLQNAKATANLGVCYQYGRGVERDSVEAIRLYVTAIENGQQELLEQRKATYPNNIFDDMLVGLCYEKGVGTLRDVNAAAKSYSAAADRGSVDGMVAAARMLIECGKPTEAVKYLDKAARAGNIDGAYLLGKMRLGNMGVSADKPTVVANFTKAAEANLPEAQTALGTLYFTGEIVGQDYNNAMMWLSRAAQAGDAEGMWQYGQLLRAMNDYDQALFWMSQAAEAGYLQKFVDWYRHAPKDDPYRRYVSGMANLVMHNSPAASIDDFKSVSKAKVDDGTVMEAVVLAAQGDGAKAAKILDKLAAQSPHAAYELGRIYLNGTGVKRDPARGVKLYRQAANAGYGYAQNALADLYYDGINMSMDRKEAARLYKEAYTRRQLSAQGAERLRAMYETGAPGVSADPIMAARLAAYQPSVAVIRTLSTVKSEE